MLSVGDSHFEEKHYGSLTRFASKFFSMKIVNLNWVCLLEMSIFKSFIYVNNSLLPSANSLCGF